MTGGGGGIPLVCRLRLVCHPETAGLCGGFSLCKVTFISRISHYVKERIVVIMLGGAASLRRVLRLFLSAQGGAALLRCRPCVCEAGCLTSYVRFACTGGTASLRCWGMCGAGMPHLLCAFPVGVLSSGGAGLCPCGGAGLRPCGGAGLCSSEGAGL